MSRSASPLHAVLTIPFLLIVLLAVLISNFLIWKHASQAQQVLVSNLSNQAKELVSTHIKEYLNLPILANKSANYVLQTRKYADEKSIILQRDFLLRVESLPSVNTLQYGTAQGEYIGVGRSAENSLVYKLSDKNTNYAFNTYDIAKDKQLGKLLWSRENYDPRIRPWYKAAVERQAPVWSHVYVMFSTKQLGLTLSQPVNSEEKKLIGVVGTDILLEELSSYLKNLNISENTVVFIQDDIGHLVATSTDEPLTQEDGSLLSAEQSTHALIKMAAKKALTIPADLREKNSPYKVSFSDNKKNYFIEYAPYKDAYGLNWGITIVIPEDDFLQDIKAGQKRIALLSLLVLLLALLFATYTTFRIKHSIDNLQKSVNAMQNGDTELPLESEAIGVHSIKEFRELASSFHAMRNRLDHSTEEIQKMGHELQSQAHTNQDLISVNKSLQTMSFVDGLTNLFNRRRFDQAYAEYWQRIESQDLICLSLIMCDVDQFKAYNDNYGHQSGDDVLVSVAACIEAAVRTPKDLAARYGGEEFIIIMPNADAKSALRAAHQILHNVVGKNMPHQYSYVAQHVTISAGVATIMGADLKDLDAEQFLKAVDDALYAAKNAGRNQVMVADV